MSQLIVEVCAIEEIKAHSNADRVEMVRVKNWWTVAAKGFYKVGDKVIYLPPDAVITEELADKWGIKKYCPPVPKGFRIKAQKFRGERSYGTIQSLDDPDWPVGKDVAEHFGITKYEPPLTMLTGDIARPVEAFHMYTDIQNLGNYPGVFQDGEEVAIDEKIHGTNCRVGLLMHWNETDQKEVPTYMAGSHGTRRNKFDDKGTRSLYWLPHYNESVGKLLHFLFDKYGNCPVIIFGEIFGLGIQDMQYGTKEPQFRAFDISVNGRYLDYDNKIEHLRSFGIQEVPPLYRGPFSMQVVNELVDGPTNVCPTDTIKEKFKGREGIVIRPIKERHDPILCGRAILKYVSADYYDRKNANPTDFH